MVRERQAKVCIFTAAMLSTRGRVHVCFCIPLELRAFFSLIGRQIFIAGVFCEAISRGLFRHSGARAFLRVVFGVKACVLSIHDGGIYSCNQSSMGWAEHIRGF